MAVQVLTDVRGYVGGLDVTGVSNKIELDATAAPLDATTYGSAGWFTRVGGIKGAKVAIEGFFAAGAVPGLDQQDDRMWADLIGGTSVPITLVGTSGAVGSQGYCGRILDVEYKTFGKVGDLMPFTLTGNSDGPFGDAQVLHPQGTARTTTGNGTGVQFPALVLGQKMYMALHVLSISGTTPSITCVVQSDTSNAFAAPTTRATFTAVTTTTGAQLLVAAGPITDTWWRINWTITGTTPSFLFAASAGIA